MSLPQATTAFITKVEAALPRRAGATPRQIFDAIDIGTPGTVRNAIRALVRDGRAAFVGEEGKRRYRRIVRRPDASGRGASAR